MKDDKLYLIHIRECIERVEKYAGQAAGTPRNLHFYFRDDHVGLIKDFKKLDELSRSLFAKNQSRM